MGKTAETDLNFGKRPALSAVVDACADRDPRPHEANLFDLQAKYAEVISETEALQKIIG